MTNEIEQAKREMFNKLASLRGKININYSLKDMLEGADVVDIALEDYLEELSQEKAALEQRLETQGQSIKTLQHNCMGLTTERDDLRNRLQAFEFANETAGVQLRAANELIQRQRESIKELRTAKEARETDACTSPQRSEENTACVVLGALPMLCQHSYQYMHDVPSGDLKPRCIFCRVLLEK